MTNKKRPFTKKLETPEPKPEPVIVPEQEIIVFTFGEVAKIVRREPETRDGKTFQQKGFYFIIYTPGGEAHEAKALSLQAALTNVKAMIPDAVFEQGFKVG
ncbi:hypothetical protein AB4463_03175 [Vibrio cyclitrophicus]